MRRALVLTHVPFEDPGSLDGVLRERGFLVEVRDVCTADPADLLESDADLLVAMGGPIGVYESAAYPFLEAEISLLQSRLQRAAPTIGICLGAQLMAAALGAAVYPGRKGKEIGWSILDEGRDVAACPAIAEFLSARVQVLHWHGDTFDLPAGAAHLGSSSIYANQAWSLGEHALALQFHPEVSVAGLERWYVGHACELTAANIDITQLRREGRKHAPLLEPAAKQLWHRWLDSAFGIQPQPAEIRRVHHA